MGYISNKGFKIIEGIIWTLAIVGMIGLLIVVRELRSEVKELKSITITK